MRSTPCTTHLRRTYMLQLEWVPGQVGIEGNERVDQAAKQAAIQKINTPPQKTILKLARSNVIHQSIKRQWREQWINDGGTAAQLRNITKRPNIVPNTQIYDKLGNNRRHIAWIARLRTEHCSLNQYLERFNIIDDSVCDWRRITGIGQSACERAIIRVDSEKDGVLQSSIRDRFAVNA